MKRIIYFGIVLSVLMLFACGKATVEDVAKEYVKKQCAFDNDFKIDTSKLKYTVTEKEGNRATVRVSGTINFDGQLFLVKSGKKWRISKKENVYATQEKAVSHNEQTTSHQQTAHQ
jgi:uncharacterized cupredoxin-like copper-binding protein